MRRRRAVLRGSDRAMVDREGRVFPRRDPLPATVLVLLLLAGPGLGEDWRREVDAWRPRHVLATEAAMLDELERRALDALAAIPRAKTAGDADRARADLRRKLERSLGVGRLPWPPDLRPRVVGTLRRPGYRIEKVIYETLPGMAVPGHLYV